VTDIEKKKEFALAFVQSYCDSSLKRFEWDKYFKEVCEKDTVIFLQKGHCYSVYLERKSKYIFLLRERKS
jgi:hypothetical protein